jgi:uncharacterized protein YgiM (DUF1202 family)
VSTWLGIAAVLLLTAQWAAGQSSEQARVPTSHANVHKGPSSNDPVLVLVPEGTLLPIIGRRGEWLQVQLSPELRNTGLVMRWYENETAGWMHDSTIVTTATPYPCSKSSGACPEEDDP